MEQSPPQSDFQIRFRKTMAELEKCGVAALTDLYDLAAPRALRYALTLLRNQHDAEEALQATFVKVASSMALFVQADSPWAYFMQIVRHEAYNILRKQKRQMSLEFAPEIAEESDFNYDDVEQQQSIEQALQRLPAEQAEVVILKIWEELTFQEIGLVLNQSPNTIASRYRYALSKLEQSLQTTFEDFYFDDARS